MTPEDRAQKWLEENQDREVVVETKGDRPTPAEFMRALGFDYAADWMEAHPEDEA